MLVLLIVSSFLFFTLVYVLYYSYVRRYAQRPWNLEIDNDYQPSISILVPVHNEEENILKKLENLQEVVYPREKMEVVVVDDASEDRTLSKANEAIRHNLGFDTRIVKRESRGGKAVALNFALTVASNPMIIVSDADTLWPSNILEKALPYLADKTVGALTGQGINDQANESWVTEAEDNYLQLTSSIRLGESKMHSTIRFEGGFCVYKRAAFDKFDCESGSDDSGTALDIVQHNFRTIFVPEVVFYTAFPTSLRGKLRIKSRRANQLIGLWIKCLKFMLRKRLMLPKRIVLSGILLFLINPLVFLLLTTTAVMHVFLYPLSVFSLLLLAAIMGLLVCARARSLFLELVVDNFLLVYASLGYLFGRRYVAWEKSKSKTS